IEKARKYLENFEEIQPYPVSFVVFDGERDFFLYATGFFGLVKCDCPFIVQKPFHPFFTPAFAFSPPLGCSKCIGQHGKM
ncbi:MAG: hypothetical protein IJW50_07745, partial [Clostridia bacterium]|nr:hypothetical protein [Clostridia bacterium]